MKQRTLKLTLTLLTVFEALQLFCTFITTCCKRQSRWMWKSPKAQKLQVLSAMWGRMFLHPSVYKMRNLYKLPVPHYGTLIFICCNLFWQCLKKNYLCFIAKKMSSYERKLLELCQTLKPFEETTLKVKKEMFVSAILAVPFCILLKTQMKTTAITYNTRMVTALMSSLDKFLSK